MLIQLSMLLTTAAVAQAGTPATTATTGAAPSASTVAAEPAKEKKICRKLTTSGTRMEKRVCLTKSQWAKIDAQG